MASNQVPQWFVDKVNGIDTKLDSLLHWKDTHEHNHHGRHGRRYLNRANAQGLLVVGLIAERILSVAG